MICKVHSGNYPGCADCDRHAYAMRVAEAVREACARRVLSWIAKGTSNGSTITLNAVASDLDTIDLAVVVEKVTP